MEPTSDKTLDNYTCQRDIEKLFNEVISLPVPEYIEYYDITFDILKRLNNIFSHKHFRPHYFFIYDAKLDLTDTERAYNNTIAIIQFLSEKPEFQDTTDKLLFEKYETDKDFKFKTDMFFSAIKYETGLRLLALRNEDLENQISQLNKAKDSKESMTDEIRKANNILGELRDANDTLTSIKQATENALLDITTDSKVYREYLDEFNTTKERYKEFRKTIENAKSDYSNLTTNMLTVLGIFVALVIAFITSYLSTIAVSQFFTNIVQIKFAYIALMGQILINLIFGLIFMIAKLTGRQVNTNCLGCGGSQCSKKTCTPIHKLINKFPYVFWCNLLFFVVYVVFFVWWYLDEYVYTHIKDFLILCSSGSEISTFFFVSINLVLIFALFYTIWNYIKKIYKHNFISQDTINKGAPLDNNKVNTPL